jgi:lysylphosphatidylglycerol synthetase-like protein (DUF2156 family)
MNEIWLSIKAWTQRIVISALVIYAGFFVYKNSSDSVKFWFWFDHEHTTTVFLLAAGAFAAGMIFAVLISTALKTLRQIRDLRSRSRQEKLERDLIDMKAKAAMLQTKPAGEATDLAGKSRV